MNLPIEAAALVLVAAFLHASWNALVKAGHDRLMVLAVANATGVVISVMLSPFVLLPLPASWPFLLGSIILHTGYYFFLIRAYRVGDLSHVYPMARGLSPMLVALLAAVFANEIPTPWGMFGVVLACAGIISLAFESGPPWRGDARPVIYAVGTAVFIAAYTLMDGMGVRRAGDPFSYIVWLMLLDGIPIIAFTAFVRRHQLIASIGGNWRAGCTSGVLQFGAYALIIWAMSLGAMASVSALRETSVIFAAIIGVVVLKERVGALRIAAAILVALGIVLMRIADI
ncbi:MAG: EamA family transporter [Gammaproteobacteria bacterium]|jgi:drug/metabolite transporter (DMT)-like permease|nr:EamA family transporter [Gammaproteobacteria bacterium]MDX2461794.1 EamA family transporter [Gammaproteobacteria bacterium]